MLNWLMGFLPFRWFAPAPAAAEPVVTEETIAEGKRKAMMMRSSRVIRATFSTIAGGPGYGPSTELYLLQDNNDHGFKLGESVEAIITRNNCPGRDLLEHEGLPLKFTVMRFLSSRDQQRLERGLDPESRVIEITAVHRA